MVAVTVLIRIADYIFDILVLIRWIKEDEVIWAGFLAFFIALNNAMGMTVGQDRGNITLTIFYSTGLGSLFELVSAFRGSPSAVKKSESLSELRFYETLLESAPSAFMKTYLALLYPMRQGTVIYFSIAFSLISIAHTMSMKKPQYKLMWNVFFLFDAFLRIGGLCMSLVVPDFRDTTLWLTPFVVFLLEIIASWHTVPAEDLTLLFNLDEQDHAPKPKPKIQINTRPRNEKKQKEKAGSTVVQGIADSSAGGANAGPPTRTSTNEVEDSTELELRGVGRQGNHKGDVVKPKYDIYADEEKKPKEDPSLSDKLLSKLTNEKDNMVSLNHYFSRRTLLRSFLSLAMGLVGLFSGVWYLEDHSGYPWAYLLRWLLTVVAVAVAHGKIGDSPFEDNFKILMIVALVLTGLMFIWIFKKKHDYITSLGAAKLNEFMLTLKTPEEYLDPSRSLGPFKVDDKVRIKLTHYSKEYDLRIKEKQTGLVVGIGDNNRLAVKFQNEKNTVTIFEKGEIDEYLEKWLMKSEIGASQI